MGEQDGLIPVIVCNASLNTLYNKVGALGNEHKPCIISNRWLRFKHRFRALRVGFSAGPIDYDNLPSNSLSTFLGQSFEQL